MCAHSPLGDFPEETSADMWDSHHTDLLVVWPDYYEIVISVARQADLSNTCALRLCAVLGCLLCLLPALLVIVGTFQVLCWT